MTNLMSPIELANQAYDKGFQWWFLMLLICVLLGGIVIFKYLINKQDRSEIAHAARSEKTDAVHAAQVKQLVDELTASRQHHHDRMETLMGQFFKQSTDMGAVIAANTAESREVRRLLEVIQNERLRPHPGK